MSDFNVALFNQLKAKLDISEPISDFDKAYESLAKNTKDQLIHMLLAVVVSSNKEIGDLWESNSLFLEGES